MGKFIDLTGKRFGKLTVIKQGESHIDLSGKPIIYWDCKCDCGNTTSVRGVSLRSGRSKSCGCSQKKDISGQRFGRLVAIKPTDVRKGKGTDVFWLCNCDCGNKTLARCTDLVSGHTKSCGCLLQEVYDNPATTTHGMSKTRLYNTWCCMKARCENKNNTSYDIYGGKGVSVCDEWRTDFLNFYNWAYENGYNDDLSIDRIDGDGNYEPNNCRWATAKEQANNICTNRMITVDGVEHTSSEWSDITGFKANTIRERLERGWTEYDAVNRPLMS